MECKDGDKLIFAVNLRMLEIGVSYRDRMFAELHALTTGLLKKLHQRSVLLSTISNN